MKINICIVHYNTPYMTECLIKSINKYVGLNCNIYIFDNSDKQPFTYIQDNIIIFDNTKGQIINFDVWLKKFPNKGGEASKKFISAKHCISIEKCMELINDNFILMDSDILLKQDISFFFNEEYMYVGEINDNNALKVPRLLPFICFINVNKCKKEGIHYFYDNMMHGLNRMSKGQYYDTGAGFVHHAQKYKHKLVKISDYIIHYKGASWDINYGNNKKEHGSLTPEQWLNNNNKYWNTKKNKQVIYTCITGEYEKIIDPSVVSNDFDYICFTDKPNVNSRVWDFKPIPVELKELTKVKQQRVIKICPHKYLSEYDLSIWVDGSVDIIGNINNVVQKQCSEQGKTIFIPEHPSRKCIYQEGNVCINLKKDTKENINPQLEKYKQEKFPTNYGLVQSNIIIRKHNDINCINIMEIWEKEIINNSHRDQLSFNYALWKNNNDKTFKYLSKTLCNSEYFKWYSRHNRKENTPITNKEYILNKKTNTVSKQNVQINKQQKVKKKQIDANILDTLREAFNIF